MIRFFGNLGSTSDPMPLTHDEDRVLITYFRRTPIAKGRWVKKGFYLLRGSLIKIDDTFKDNKGVGETKRELIKLGWVIKSKDNPKYFILEEDIGLYSRSTAARLVHGTGRNGSCWI